MSIPWIDSSNLDVDPLDLEKALSDNPKEVIVDVVNMNDVEIDDRTRARGIALQVLYELDLSDHLPNQIIKERLESVSLSPELEVFVEKIVLGVLPYKNIIDGFIETYAPEWPIDQVAVIDRNLVRIAVWEFVITSNTPVKVAINESVELAKLFGSESSPRFVNGVLGNFAENLHAIRKSLQKHT